MTKNKIQEIHENKNLYIKGFYLIKIKISRSSIVKIDTMIVNINQYEIVK